MLATLLELKVNKIKWQKKKLNGNLSTILAWRVLWTGDPGGLQFMGSQRLRHARTHPCVGLDTAPDLGCAPVTAV